MPSIPALGRQRQADLCELEANLVLRASSMTGSKATKKPCLKNQKKNYIHYFILCIHAWPWIYSKENHDNRDMGGVGGKTAQQLRVIVTKPDDLSSISRTQRMEGDNQLQQILFCPRQVCTHVCTSSPYVKKTIIITKRKDRMVKDMY